MSACPRCGAEVVGELQNFDLKACEWVDIDFSDLYGDQVKGMVRRVETGWGCQNCKGIDPPDKLH